MLKPREAVSADREDQSFNRVVEFFSSYLECDIEVPPDFFLYCVVSNQDLKVSASLINCIS